MIKDVVRVLGMVFGFAATVFVINFVVSSQRVMFARSNSSLHEIALRGLLTGDEFTLRDSFGDHHCYTLFSFARLSPTSLAITTLNARGVLETVVVGDDFQSMIFGGCMGLS